MSLEESKAQDSPDVETQGGSREKICRVCGDKALGYNFNAITCESCKAFFRRNALKNKEFKCPFDKKCDINPVTRRFCQLCRLIKCFEIGMRKEYIMSEDDKREKRIKIEKNRAIKKRSMTEVDGSSLAEPKRKEAKIGRGKEDEIDDEEGKATEEDDEEEEDEEQGEEEANDEEAKKKLPNIKSVKINLLNMASTSKKTYQKKKSKCNANVDQSITFPFAGLPESSSPETAAVTESRTCNAFDQMRNSSQSRSVEIYQISKSKETGKSVHVEEKNFSDSNIIRIILDSEFSKPSEVYTNSTVSREMEEGKKICNYRDGFRSGGDYIISDATSFLEIAKNNDNILLESARDGKQFLVINKDSVLMRDRRDKKSGSGKKKNVEEDRLENAGMRETSTPLLSSLMESRRSFDDSRSPSTKTPSKEDIFHENPRTSSLCLTNSIDSILSEAIKLEYEAYTSMNSRMNGRELNDAERAKLNELIVANKALLAPLEDDLSGDDFGFNAIAGCGPSVLVDVLNLTAVAIRRLIKMSKKINAFKNMCQDDQIALLKGGCTEMMILRSAMTYDPDRDSWKIPQSKEKLMNIKVDILKEAGGRVFEEHQRFLQTFDPKWRNDENIMLILSAIALFSPDRPRVVHYDVIKLEQNSYYYLLRRYLESVYQGCEARLTFLKLIHKISELHKLNEDHVRVYLDANPREIEPLLIEIFDLKPH